MLISEGQEGRVGKLVVATGQDQPPGRKNKVQRSHQDGKGRTAVGYGERIGPPRLAGGRDLGKAHGQWNKSRGQWKLSLRGRKGQLGRSSISGD